MRYEDVEIQSLRVNKANDRHGEVVDESAAIAELFRLHDSQMRALARDIVSEGAIYDPPLVLPTDSIFVVYDGNRRVTCMKLLLDPQRAPTQDLQAFFREARQRWVGGFPHDLTCQVEEDRNIIDAILRRRHTGQQGGIGQLAWNDRAKHNFEERTGQGSAVNIAAEVERFLTAENRVPPGSIPWSTLTRLLSSEEFRGRVGVSTAGREFRFTHDREAVADALERIARDLANQTVTLGHLWNNEGKRAYLARLEEEGVLPSASERLPQPEPPASVPRRRRRQPRPALPQITFIPQDAPSIPWTAAQQRVRAIWEELQSLELATHPNAISALLRMLVELAVEGYHADHNLGVAEGLSRRFGAVSAHLRDRGILNQAYWTELERIRRDDQLISVPSMQRYLHSPDFAPMEGELRAYWTRLHRFLAAALSN